MKIQDPPPQGQILLDQHANLIQFAKTNTQIQKEIQIQIQIQV